MSKAAVMAYWSKEALVEGKIRPEVKARAAVMRDNIDALYDVCDTYAQLFEKAKQELLSFRNWFVTAGEFYEYVFFDDIDADTEQYLMQIAGGCLGNQDENGKELNRWRIKFFKD